MLVAVSCAFLATACVARAGHLWEPWARGPRTCGTCAQTIPRIGVICAWPSGAALTLTGAGAPRWHRTDGTDLGKFCSTRSASGGPACPKRLARRAREAFVGVVGAWASHLRNMRANYSPDRCHLCVAIGGGPWSRGLPDGTAQTAPIWGRIAAHVPRVWGPLIISFSMWYPSQNDILSIFCIRSGFWLKETFRMHSGCLAVLQPG